MRWYINECLEYANGARKLRDHEVRSPMQHLKMLVAETRKKGSPHLVHASVSLAAHAKAFNPASIVGWSQQGVHNTLLHLM